MSCAKSFISLRKLNDSPIPRLNCQGKKLITSLYLEEDSFAFCVGTEQFCLHICPSAIVRDKATRNAKGVCEVGTGYQLVTSEEAMYALVFWCAVMN